MNELMFQYGGLGVLLVGGLLYASGLFRHVRRSLTLRGQSSRFLDDANCGIITIAPGTSFGKAPPATRQLANRG